jgi:hypothetical protein
MNALRSGAAVNEQDWPHIFLETRHAVVDDRRWLESQGLICG